MDALFDILYLVQAVYSWDYKLCRYSCLLDLSSFSTCFLSLVSDRKYSLRS